MKTTQNKGLQLYQGIDRSKWALIDFINEGTDISWKVQETEFSYPISPFTENQEDKNNYYFKITNIHDHFLIWYIELKDFLFKNGLFSEKHPDFSKVSILLNAGRVPRIRKSAIEVSGTGYGNPLSKESQKLAQSIREEAKDILLIIQNLKPLKSFELNKKDKLVEINKIEVLEDKTEIKRVIIYINTDYNKPRDYRRGKNWGLLYQLALERRITFSNKKKAFVDYFNSNSKNPLYTKEGFKISKILKQEDGDIVPNIEITITTSRKVTTQLKSA